MSKATSKWEDQKILALRGGVGVILAYAFLSRALSTGSYWHYLLAVVLMALGIPQLVRSFKIWYEKAR
jgi:uncharacterized membrane protein HdeD (DUF308 family)